MQGRCLDCFEKHMLVFFYCGGVFQATNFKNAQFLTMISGVGFAVTGTSL